MGERRAVAQILNYLREGAAESDTTEADVLAKTTIVERKRKAFKKHRDTALGVVVKKKLADRRDQLNVCETDATEVMFNNTFKNGFADALKTFYEEHGFYPPLPDLSKMPRMY